MRAFLAAAVLAAAPAPALAQSTAAPPPPTTNTPATDAIGPSELQNFSLKGTVTRQADQPATPTPARPQAQPVRSPGLSTAPSRTASQRNAQRTPAPTPPVTPPVEPTTSLSPAPQPVAQQPAVPAPAVQAPVPAAAASKAPALDLPSTPSKLPLWPWIAAALALAAGAAFLLWRRWPRPVVADGPLFDLLAPAPESAPEPEFESPPPLDRPEPSRPDIPGGIVTSRLRQAAPAGIVASRLRPALELGFHPLRCQVDDDKIAIEFELELFNAGSAPARAVLAEASLLNAGATQEHELSAFFANPHGEGERLAIIPPMQRVSLKSQVVAPRDAVHEYELAGRKTFVPVIAFNALYEWSGGSAQSSAAYLVGRDTQQDKLGPLRLDQGAREFRALGARPLPTAVRT